MKKLVLTVGFLAALPLQAYVIKNRSEKDLTSTYNYGKGREAEDPEVIKSGDSIKKTNVHFTHGRPARRIISVALATDGKTVAIIDLSTYNDNQIRQEKTLNKKPVVFTVNPDFTISASEKGSKGPAAAPEAPPAPKPQIERKKSSETSRAAGAGSSSVSETTGMDTSED